MMEKTVLNHLETERQRLLKKRQLLVDDFAKAAGGNRPKRLSQLFIKIQQTNNFLESLGQIEADAQAANAAGPRRYAVSSLFLHESFRKLTADQDEQFFFITGAEVNGVLVLDQWAEFAHQRRSRLGVVADMPSTHRLLIKLEQFGHKFLAHFHSHPGNGADSTRPSGTDEGFQKRLESAGHLAVMAVFSRDGFVRLVRLDRNFAVEIYGEGVERHAENVYRLTNLD